MRLPQRNGCAPPANGSDFIVIARLESGGKANLLIHQMNRLEPPVQVSVAALEYRANLT